MAQNQLGKEYTQACVTQRMSSGMARFAFKCNKASYAFLRLSEKGTLPNVSKLRSNPRATIDFY